MGYFDALTSGTFKTTQDGQRLFFPWGALGRGYILESEADYERLRRQVKTYLVVGMVATVGPIVAGRAYLLGIAAVTIWCVFYLAWTAWRLRGLQPSSERLTVREARTAQARAHSPIFLWAGQIGSLLFVAGGVFILVVNPHQWLAAAGVIFFFGFCAICFV